eukprot:jgi/Mesvir1/17256/Mv07665-RA.1
MGVHERSEVRLPLSLDEIPPSRELVDYYRARLAEADQEREDIIQKIDLCRATHEELHKWKWEAQQRAEELAEAQKALSDAHLVLFEERERVLAIQAENDALRVQELDDRKRIQHLIALTQPLREDDVLFDRDVFPETLSLFPRFNEGQEGPARARHERGAPATRSPLAPKARPPKESVLRTVYLPSERTDTLLVKVEALQAQLAEARQFANERVGALLEERRVAEINETARADNERRHREDLEKNLRLKEEVLQQTMRDYLVSRHALLKERTAMEEAREKGAQLANTVDQFRLLNELLLEVVPPEVQHVARQMEKAIERRRELFGAMRETLAAVREAKQGGQDNAGVAASLRKWMEGRGLVDEESLLTEMARDTTDSMLSLIDEELVDLKQKAKGALHHVNEEYIAEFKGQMKSQDDYIKNLEISYAAVRVQSGKRIQALVDRVRKQKQQYRELQHRRALDLEGFTNDITLLRKKLAVVDRRLHQMRLMDRLEDDDRLDALIAAMERYVPSLAASDDDDSATSSQPRRPRATKGTLSRQKRDEVKLQVKDIKSKLTDVVARLRKTSSPETEDADEDGDPGSVQ